MASENYTAFRRCRVECTCNKCGRVIKAGDPNFDYNTRDRSAGKYCNDCSKGAGWNAKQNRVETVEEWQREGSTLPNETTAKFNGICFVCKKPTVQGITRIDICRDGVNWKHTYCKEVAESETFTPRTWEAETEVDAAEITPEKTEVNVTQKTTVVPTGMNPITAMIWEEIKPLVATVETSSADVSEQISRVKDLIDQLTTKVNSRPTEELKVIRLDETEVKIDNPHPQLSTLIMLASVREHVYLYGPAGSGKSTGAWQVSQALGLEFYSVSLNRQSTPSLIVGFIDAHGKYVETDFYKAYSNGGIFLIDEMDNASGNLLTTLNSALANGHMTFPCGRINKHADFICIATGNTSGRGADRMYNERQQLDAATLDRFEFIDWGYDEQAEMKWALAINEQSEEWVKHVHKLRANAVKNSLRVAVTPRASLKGAKLLKIGMTFEQLEHMLVFKGLDKDTILKIRGAK